MGDDLIVPGRGRKQRPVRVLEHRDRSAALITVPRDVIVQIETPDEILMLEAGGWMIVDAALWASIVGQVAEAKQILDASNKAGRQARKIHRRIAGDLRN